MKIEKYNTIKAKKPKLIDFELFYSYKAFPREFRFNYLKHRYFLYVYLDPFKCYLDNKELGYIENPDYFFGYEPFYIGKGTNGHGYRMNQHISIFQKNQETNIIKRKKFEEIETKMKSNKYPDKPKNWTEYKNNYIIILNTFNSEKELQDAEIILINKIGTIYQQNGPLVNKITNYEIQKYKRRFEDDYYS